MRLRLRSSRWCLKSGNGSAESVPLEGARLWLLWQTAILVQLLPALYRLRSRREETTSVSGERSNWYVTSDAPDDTLVWTSIHIEAAYERK